VRELKGGAFTAAKGLDIDVIPVGLAYTPGHELAGGRTGDHVRSFLARPSTPVWIAIGDPIPMSSLPTKGLEAPVRAAVQELVHVARRGAIDAGVGAPGSEQSASAASNGGPR
jgi:hypothetical protein